MPPISASPPVSTTAPGTPAASSASLTNGEHNRRVEARIGNHVFSWGSRTYVMGIVNVTPDSFSGDGLGLDHEAAIAHGLRMVEEGADLLDVGGESTRPGHQPVGADVEIARVLPVIEALAARVGVPISIDTTK